MMDTLQARPTVERYWYAVQARPKQEQRAAMNLASSGVTTFLPMLRELHTNGRVGTAPLFPRYLFARCDGVESLPRIRYTRGVAKVLGTGDGPTAVDDAIIESIRDRVGADGFVELTQSLEAGDRVEITTGPLKGLVGIFDSSTSACQRVVLLLNAVSVQMRVQVDTSVVRRMTA